MLVGRCFIVAALIFSCASAYEVEQDPAPGPGNSWSGDSGSSESAPSGSSSEASKSTSGFDFATVQFSQFTIDTLWDRYFADFTHRRFDAAIGATIASWQEAFNVTLGQDCLHGNDVTAFQSQGQVLSPTASHTLERLQLTLLEDGTLGLYGRTHGHASSTANAWAVEGFCITTVCHCGNFPVQTMCEDAALAFDFDVSFRARIDLSPDAEGRLPLPIVEVHAELPHVLTNGCRSVDGDDELLWFSRKFNETFIDSVFKNFTALIPSLNETLFSQLQSFIVDTVRPAMARQFPEEYHFATGLRAAYTIQGLQVSSTAQLESGRTAPDSNASLIWNVSADFSAKLSESGKTYKFEPKVKTVGPVAVLPGSLGARVVTSSEAVRVLAWYAGLHYSVNLDVNNTILDATINTKLMMDLPSAELTRPFRPIPYVSPSASNTSVEALVRGQGGNGGLPSLFLRMNHSASQVDCKEGTLVLLKAAIDDITARTYLVMQIDPSEGVMAPPSSSGPNHHQDEPIMASADEVDDQMVAAMPNFIPSLFVWIVDYNHFKNAVFQIEKPTGGIPKDALADMLQKALNESMPTVNRGYRAARFHVPPAVSLLLNPAEQTSHHKPQTMVVNSNGNATADAGSDAQRQIVFETLKPNASIPIPAPTLTEALPMVVSLSTVKGLEQEVINPSASGGVGAAVGSNHYVEVQDSRAYLSPRCDVMMTIKGTLYYWRLTNFSIVSVYAPEGGAKTSGGDPEVQAVWPAAARLFCTTPDCTKCLMPDEVALKSQVGGGVFSAALNLSSIGKPQSTLSVTATQPGSTGPCQQPVDIQAATNGDAPNYEYFVSHGCMSDHISNVAANKSSRLETSEISAYVLMDAPSTAKHLNASCLNLPTARKEPEPQLFAWSKGNIVTVPCAQCPSSPGEIRSSCPDASTFVVTTKNSMTPELRCHNFVETTGVRTNFSLGVRDQLPSCPTLVLVPPVPHKTPFDIGLWLSLIIAFTLVLGLVVFLAVRIYKGIKEQRAKEALEGSFASKVELDTTNSKFEADDDAEDDGGGADGGLQASTGRGSKRIKTQAPALPHAIIMIVGAGCGLLFLCGSLVFLLQSPFGRLTTAQAQASGVPHSINFNPLEDAFSHWTNSIVAALNSVGGLLLLGVLLLLIPCLRTVVFRNLPMVTFAIPLCIVVGIQFAVLTPPIVFKTRDLAQANLNISTESSILSARVLNGAATKAASGTAVLFSIPVVMCLLQSLASALPIATALAGWLRFKTCVDLRTRPQLKWSASNGAPIQWWPKGLEKARAAAVPLSSLRVVSLCCASVLLVNLIFAAMTYQCTRDVAPLVFSVFQAILGGILPIVATREACVTLQSVFDPMESSTDEGDPLLDGADENGVVARLSLKWRRLRSRVDTSDRVRNTKYIALFTLGADLVLALIISSLSHKVAPAFPMFVLHVCSLLADTAFFYWLDNTGKEPEVPTSPLQSHRRDDDEAKVRPRATLFKRLANFAASISDPWWRLPFVLIAALFVTLSFQANARTALHDNLRNELINYLEENGIQFPKKRSSIHLFIDPGLEVYDEALKMDLVFLGIGTFFVLVSAITATIGGARQRMTSPAPRAPDQPMGMIAAAALAPTPGSLLLKTSRISTIFGYLMLLLAALYFTLPDFVQASHLENIVPHCGPEFFREGETALKTFAHIFFSSVEFGRLLPLVVTFPPAVVRVLYLLGTEKGDSEDQFSPMLVATLITALTMQLPLLSIVLAAGDIRCVWLGAALPVTLFLIVALFHPFVRGQGRFLKHAPLLWLFFYIIGWVSLIWSALVANEQIWRVAQKLFESAAAWYELIASIFLATVVFCDIVWVVERESTGQVVPTAFDNISLGNNPLEDQVSPEGGVGDGARLLGPTSDSRNESTGYGSV